MSLVKFKIEVSAGTWRDASDQVIAMSKLPLTQVNADFTTVAKGFTFDVSETFAYTSVLIKNAEVRVHYGTEMIFLGYIREVLLNKDNHAYEVDVDNKLQLLKSYTIHNDVLNADIITDATYGADGYNNSIRLRSVIDIMFGMAGISFNDSEVGVSTAYVVKGKSVRKAVGGSLVTRDFTYSNVRVDPYMLYGINQSVSAGYTVMQNTTYNASRMNFFDFVNYVFKTFGIRILFKDGFFIFKWLGNAGATALTIPSYVIDDDNMYSNLIRDYVDPPNGEYAGIIKSNTRAIYNAIAGGQSSLLEITTFKSGDFFIEENLEIRTGMIFLLADTELGTFNVYKWDETANYKINCITPSDGIAFLHGREQLVNPSSRDEMTVELNELWDDDYINNNIRAVDGSVSVDCPRRKGFIIERTIS